MLVAHFVARLFVEIRARNLTKFKMKRIKRGPHSAHAKKIRVTHGQKGSLLFGIFCLNALSTQEDMFKNSNVVTL